MESLSTRSRTVDEMELGMLTLEIKRVMHRSARDIVRIGYMLNRVMEDQLYANDYSDFDTYLRQELNIDYTMATRFIRMNKKYASEIDGMEIALKYEDYSQGLLIEMLNMTPEQEAKVTPDMTVKQAREIKRQDKEEQASKSDTRKYMSYEDAAISYGMNLPDTTETAAEPEEVATSQPDSEAEVHGELWFVLEYWRSATATSKEKAKLSAICREENNNTDRGRAIQRYLAPYGYHGGNCYTFYGYARGIDFQIKHQELHMTYTRFAADLMKILESEGMDKGAVATSQPVPEDMQLPGQLDLETDFPEYLPEEPQKEEIIDAEFREIDDSVVQEEIATSQPDENADVQDEEEIPSGIWGIRQILEEQKKLLNEMLAVEGLPQMTVFRQKTIVGALAAMICDLEREEEAEPQSELPELENNDQRKTWLNHYKGWGLWYRDEHIDVNYYKYDFSDGSRLIVAEYPQRITEWSHQKEDLHFFHLLEKNKKTYSTTYDKSYIHFPDSETYLVEFLKNLQKK